jgi:hypothetical protein
MRKLFAILSVVVMLSMIAPTVFAEPTSVDATIVEFGGAGQLGTIFADAIPALDPVTGEIYPPGWPVEAYLYRPDTMLGYTPWFPAEWNPATEYIAPAFESELRRQTWPRNAVVAPDGFFYFAFLMPRDRAWYPCGFPCSWQCNYYDPILDAWEFHSPQAMTFVYRDPYMMDHLPLFWPWDLDWFDTLLGTVNPYGPPPFYEYYDYPITQDATPFDTVHPVELWVVDEVSDFALRIYELKVQGYRWRWSDLTVSDYVLDWPFICGGAYEFPDYANLGAPWFMP